MHLCTFGKYIQVCIRIFLKYCRTTTNCPPAPPPQIPEDQAGNNNNNDNNIQNNTDENQEDTPPRKRKTKSQQDRDEQLNKLLKVAKQEDHPVELGLASISKQMQRSLNEEEQDELLDEL